MKLDRENRVTVTLQLVQLQVQLQQVQLRVIRIWSHALALKAVCPNASVHAICTFHRRLTTLVVMLAGSMHFIRKGKLFNTN